MEDALVVSNQFPLADEAISSKAKAITGTYEKN